MKRLGIDFGTKKIGLAVTDDGGQMAFPYKVIPNDGGHTKYIEDLVSVESIEEIVIGYSLNNKGQPNKVHEKVEELVTDLTLHIGLPIHLEPEQYSTKEASHIQGKNSLTDAAAAAIILNSYITKQNN
jgi:putative Holliday junction resolvase